MKLAHTLGATYPGKTIDIEEENVMTKILLYGVMSENNFGGPSLIHGAEEIIKELHEDYEIVCYQSTKPVDIAVSDMGFQIYQIPYNKVSGLLLDAIKLKFGIQPKKEECSKLFYHIKTSDIVANLFGICFSSNFDKGKYGYIKSIKSVIGKFAISFVAKMNRIKTVKCTASYGPIKSKNDITAAKFAAKYIFDVMYARENESKNQMQSKTGIKMNIPVSPDLANFMSYNTTESNEEKYIGISVSFQIIRQWNSNETYIDCMVNLIRHLIAKTGYKVILIPNEITVDNNYNDLHVANEIHQILDYSEKVFISDVANINSTQLKTLIAGCEVMIANRYHSCVAALSAGVPTLVVGWHYKYDELLHWYGQDKWILSSENCTSDKLTTMFDDFWESRDKEREVIKDKYIDVRKALIEAGKVMFMK
jgi:polysaccharide pyruvyl transferase WcaK-like protein